MSILTSIPTSTFLGSTHHNVASAAFPVGTKVSVKQDAATGVTAGMCTFIYMRYDRGGNTPAVVGTAKDPVQLYGNDTGDFVSLTPDYSDAILYGPGAISIGGGTDGATFPTDDYYLWFQCGGPICNGNAVALATSVLDGNFETDTNIVAKDLVAFVSDGIIGENTTGGTQEIPALLGDVYGFMVANSDDSSDDIDAMHLYIIDKFAS